MPKRARSFRPLVQIKRQPLQTPLGNLRPDQTRKPHASWLKVPNTGLHFRLGELPMPILMPPASLLPLIPARLPQFAPAHGGFMILLEPAHHGLEEPREFQHLVAAGVRCRWIDLGNRRHNIAGNPLAVPAAPKSQAACRVMNIRRLQSDIVSIQTMRYS